MRSSSACPGPIDFALGASGGNSYRSGLGVDLYTLQRRQIDHQPAVTAAQAATAVSAAAYRNQHSVHAPEVYGGAHIGRVNASRYYRRPLVYHAIV